MSTLEQLIHMRTVFKSQLTRFNNNLPKFSSPDQLIELKRRFARIVRILDEYNQVQYQIELEDADADTVTTEAYALDREEFENRYFAIVSAAETKIAMLEAQTSTAQSNVTTVPSPTVTMSPANTQIKLPDIKLVEFNGSYDNWVAFHDAFVSLIDSNVNLSKIQKFYYLQGALKHDAARIIQNLEVTEANYDIALALLTERYQNNKIIIHSHIKNIFELPHVIKDNHSSLRNFVDNFQKNFRALKNLQVPTDSWDALIIHLLNSKLDYGTKREWELSTRDVTLPKLEDFLKFLNNRSQVLETLNHKTISVDNKVSIGHKRSCVVSHLSVRSTRCHFCKEEHSIVNCKKFLSLTSKDRLDEVRKLRLCTNCLKPGHQNKHCTSSSCRHCTLHHNSLLCFKSKSDGDQDDSVKTNDHQLNSQNLPLENQVVAASNPANSQVNQIATLTNTLHLPTRKHVLLATALIYIFDTHGNPIKCRALLDSGSQSSFLKKELFDKLELPFDKVHLPVTGIGKTTTHISLSSNCTIQSLHNNYKLNVKFLIVDQITSKLPQVALSSELFNVPTGATLADPEFYLSNDIDILLGAGQFWDLLRIGQIKTNKFAPILQNTVLGWIVSGPINARLQENETLTCHVNVSNETLNNQIERFWQVEDVPSSDRSKFTQEELDCEQDFVNNFSREVNGRFTVALPFKADPDLGDSKNNAINQFHSVEKHLQRNPELKSQYVAFMNEYLSLGHMTLIGDTQSNENSSNYYMPHHGVLKPSSTTTKIRVVFNASSKTTNNISLNDVLMKGPCIQDLLISIILRARKHNVLVMADICKMYRQIYIREDHRKFQNIVWRSSPDEKLQQFQLNTVTYGTVPASFLATRCLQQLAIENKESFPQASAVIISDFYIDDLISGAKSVLEAQRLIHDINSILSSGGFELRKWNSNNDDVLKDLKQVSDTKFFVISEGETSHALGIGWDAKSDSFVFNIKLDSLSRKVSKRQILSIIASIYDPIGLIGPIVIVPKILLQKLWKLKIGWDDIVPVEIYLQWINFLKNLPLISDIKVPRRIFLEKPINIQLHIFCDASEAAYGACVYARSEDDSNNVCVRLISAKSRVSPLKTIVIPRLELCGSVLAVRLGQKIVESLKEQFSSIHFWTDSSIVLSWLKIEPSRLKTFVANRVSFILQNTNPQNWHHVPSRENPADIISRGTCPDELKNLSLWWDGPHWLALQPEFWPDQSNYTKENNEMPDLKINPVALVSSESPNFDLFDKFSSFVKLVHVTAYCLRFINNANKNCQRLSGSLSVDEQHRATMVLIKIVQASEFETDIKALKSSKNVSRNSKLVSLSPFLDEQGLLRVGGRLKHSHIQYDKKFPILLPSKHVFTELLVKYEHAKNFHSGPQLTLATIRQKYWPLNGLHLVKGILRKCLPCFKRNPTTFYQKMGDLPEVRVNPGRPFLSVGIDYAGPYLIKDGKLKSRKVVKAYFCVFVCLVTKAVHIEAVTDLTTDSFLNALKRFVSRRGLCRDLYSDNATNFVAANKQLISLRDLPQHKLIQDYIASNKITWHFIPARSPHMGGIWEAAIKSAKRHLLHVCQNVTWTYEEFETILIQIEAILNSRPLSPMSNDPNDLEPLTPGHFLIGSALNAVPERDVKDTQVNRLTRYHHLQHVTQHFWTRWQVEYLHTLQQRHKWRFIKDSENLLNSLVLLKEDNSHPMQWKLGRIIQTHKGSDGLVRVVVVKTAHGETKRALSRVCLLPNTSV